MQQAFVKISARTASVSLPGHGGGVQISWWNPTTGVYDAPVLDGGIAAEVAKIRTLVHEHGGFTVGCNQLRLLCPDQLTASQQFARVAQIAQHERWSFAFQPDGSVHFGSFSRPDARG